jgi:glycosyltransferase involved in cell wall biosynthesis
MITMNEEQAVARVIGEIRAVAPAAEILLVDSSKDRTAEIAESLGARVIKQFPPKGYGPAMDLVLRSAQGEVVITLDCDGSYPTAMIPELARLVLEDGWDLVDGARVDLRGKPPAMPLVNYLANIGFGLAASVMFFRWLPRSVKQGARVKVVAITYHERIGTSTMRPLQSAWWTFKRLLRVRFS